MYAKTWLIGLLLILLIMPGGALAQEALQIISATPQDNLNSLDEGKAITVTFNYPVVPLAGVEKDSKEGPFTLTPAVSGVYRWMGTSTLTFIPDAPLAYSTRYMVQVKAPLTTPQGLSLAEDYTFAFVTPRPLVENSYPYQEQNYALLDQAIFLQFNQPVEPATVAEFAVLTSAAGVKIPLTAAAVEKTDIEEQENYWMDEPSPQLVKILPQTALDMETTYTLQLKAGLPGKGGNIGMDQAYELKFTTYNHFRAESLSPGVDWACGETFYPEFGARLTFSNPVTYKTLQEHLTIEPPVEFTDEDSSYDSNEFTLTPKFEPNTSYTITVDAAMTDVYDNALGEARVFTIKTSDYAPYIGMPNGRMIAEAYLGKRFPVKVMNVMETPFQMKAYRTPEDLLKAVKAMSEWKFDIAEPDVQRTYRPDIIKNKVAMMPFNLGEVLHEGEDTGVIGLTMDYPTCQETRKHQALIFLTNLSVTAKFSALNNLFWVTQLQDSAPVAQAQVELYDAEQKFLWQGVTDADGFLLTPGWKELKLDATDSWQQPWVFAIVRAGQDQVVIHSRDGTGLWPYRFNIEYQPNSQHLTNDGYVFTERGIYQPGEEVRVVGIVRDNKGGQLVIPQALEVVVKVTDPKGKEVFKQTLPISAAGGFNFPLQLAANAKIGTYTVECTFPLPKYLKLPKDELEWVNNTVSGNFQVENFRPVEFEVSVDLPQTEYIMGDTAQGTLKGTYLFGGAMRNVPVTWTVSRLPYTFSTEKPAWRGYEFNLRDQQGLGQVSQASEQLNDSGELAFAAKLTTTEVGSFAYSFEATVTDVNKRQVSNRREVVVHGGEYYIGLQPQSFFATVGEDFAINTVAITPDEKPLPGQAYHLQVKRVWWESVRRAGNGGRLYWESEQKEAVVQEFDVTSAEQPTELKVALADIGYYTLTAQGKDKRGNEIRAQSYFYAVGSGYAAWLREDDDYIELVPNANAFKPGETAQILVKSPYETVKALVTVEREGVLDRWVETLEGSADTIAIPIKAEYLPNVYVGVILIQERISDGKIEDELDLGKPGFKIGYTGFAVNPAERHLSVAVTPNQDEFRPGDEVAVELQVNDASGAGKEAEVVVSVVDVGVLNLINYATPDPFAYFYRARPLGVLTSELRNNIVGQRNYSQKGERQGGGGMDMAALKELLQLREKFKPTAYHNPEVRTDANGRATVKFTLPDNLTAFKIMATAHTKDAYFGAGDKRIKVNKKLMLTPSLPSFLRIGDTVQAGVVAHNRTDADQTLDIQAETSGVNLTSADVQQATLPEGDRSEVLFTYTAAQEGNATLIFRGKLADETDGVKWQVPVLLHRLPLTRALSGNTTAAAHQETITAPADAVPGWGGVTVSLAATMFTDIKGSVEYLFGYPYGCLEQKISRILPIVLAEKMITAFDLMVFKDADYKMVVQQTLDEFASYQVDNGGFGYWKNPWQPSPFVSAYAVLTLALAKKQGYEVDEDVEQKALQYLENVLKGQPERATLYRYNDLAWNTTDALIVYALSLYDGRYQAAYATRLFETRKRLPVFGKALLLKAVHAGKGEQTIQDTLKKELLNAAKISDRTAYFEEPDRTGLEWIHGSDVRTTAAVAEALLDVYGADQANEALVGKVIQWLLTQRQEQVAWRTTQENLFVFWALSTYLEAFESTPPDFTATVRLNQQEILSQSFQGRSTAVATQTVPLDQLPVGPPAPLEFTKAGEGRVYYTAVLTYLPANQTDPIDRGVVVQKKMTVLKGAGKETQSFQRGDLIKIDLTLTTPQDRLFVFVDDPLPAGFAALNFGLATTDQTLQQYVTQETPFVSSEYKTDRVVFYADYLEQGVHTVSYLVSAEHSGTFNQPPTFAAEMYTPEVFGQTGASVVNIQ